MNRKILKDLEYIEAGLFKALREVKTIKHKFRDYPDWHKTADSLASAIAEAWNEAEDLCAAVEMHCDEEGL